MDFFLFLFVFFFEWFFGRKFGVTSADSLQENLPSSYILFREKNISFSGSQTNNDIFQE